MTCGFGCGAPVLLRRCPTQNPLPPPTPLHTPQHNAGTEGAWLRAQLPKFLSLSETPSASSPPELSLPRFTSALGIGRAAPRGKGCAWLFPEPFLHVSSESP